MDWSMDPETLNGMKTAWDGLLQVVFAGIFGWGVKVAKDAFSFYLVNRVLGRASGQILNSATTAGGVVTGNLIAWGVDYVKRSLPDTTAKLSDAHIADMVKGAVGELATKGGIVKEISPR